MRPFGFSRSPSGRATPYGRCARHGGLASRTLYGLARFKGALRDRLGSEGAAVVLAGMRGPQGPRTAVRRPLTPLIEHAREVGIDYEELIGAGPTTSTSVRAFGRPPSEPEARRGRTLFGCLLSDVVVSARSGLLLAGDRALMDVQDDELSRRPHDLSVDPLIVAADADGLLLLEPADRDALPRVPEAVWLGGVHSVAFGHWIIEFLPKVFALMERPGFGEAPLLVDARMPDQHLEAVRLFAGSGNPIIVLGDHESVRVERLWVASALSYLPVGPMPASTERRIRIGLDDVGFRRLMDRNAPTLDAIDTSGAPRRLYLPRRPGQHRRLVNADAIATQLGEAGFVAVDFEGLSFAEQLRLVRGAEWIIGASGSALLTAIFGRPGLRVGALMPPFLRDVGWLAQASRPLGSTSPRSSARSSRSIRHTAGCPTIGSTLSISPRTSMSRYRSRRSPRTFGPSADPRSAQGQSAGPGACSHRRQQRPGDTRAPNPDQHGPRAA